MTHGETGGGRGTSPWPQPLELDTDIAVVGSGGAGLMCVLHAATARPELHVTVVSKGAVGRSGCTRMVQGGYNAVLDPRDSVELHFQDTLAGGKFLNDQELAWTLVNDAPRVINELETRVGCFFDRAPDGRIHQKAFAGQAFDRTVHRGDLTGIEIMGRLRDQMFRLRPHELEDVRALDLIRDPSGSLAGLTAVDMRSGRPIVLRAPVVVIATGGAATMYRVAAPAREKTGDGVAMCLRAGLPVRDMEMLQFHPTGLLAGRARMTGAVLEEGLRGAGAYLFNAEGERYMARYDPERMERATRDVVARAGYLEIARGRGTEDGGVLIDISHLGVREVESRFPGMVARTRQIGHDLARGPVPVSPTAHFHMGGVLIDRDCRTELDGLLVAGEDAGGTHGANRLGGNGVAESTVFGARAGDMAAELAARGTALVPDPAEVNRSFTRAFGPLKRESGGWPFALTNRLKELMWQRVGVVRDAEGLAEAANELAELAVEVDQVAVPGGPAVNFGWQEAMDLVNQVTVARAIVHAASWRTETRGAHARADFPDAATQPRYLVQRYAEGADAPSELIGSVHEVEFSRLSPEEAKGVRQ
ncbi:succinate dehydrogenase / fumarate reductase flavoprotein subunit/fumarate reductase flavoprotein subunit [Tamaricihabitans halophyticus]|uniref:Succinate dehydrogenase / fumarate reductase flavoprotein subunit/fumarate reductase flavoprotein subunit n=1 Tax=Tamaricihabitans halophyticus TaxID=1262583 RepID=A0A4R2Q841_9PSEU|nr:FAD-binding protein [Tamaricihabitans halophyticus]TCP44719.1 succinate dehydrogenase / fumarate reductase flavoprotein subunit/fumarate reductase flavoprotein subunit [Tamaricihabitans halophyticus]